MDTFSIESCKQNRFYLIVTGGPGNVGFLSKDLGNYRHDKPKLNENHDIELLLCHSKTKIVWNPEFKSIVMSDDDSHLLNCFQLDMISHKAYQHFGDVVILDATFNTNKYCLKFVLFNHHYQMIMFGVGLLARETI